MEEGSFLLVPSTPQSRHTSLELTLMRCFHQPGVGNYPRIFSPSKLLFFQALSNISSLWVFPSPSVSLVLSIYVSPVALPLPCVCLANSLFHYSRLTPVPRSLAFVRNEFPWCCCVVAVRCGVHTGGLLFRKLFAMFLSAAVADSAPLMLCVFPWNRCSCQRETLIGMQLKTAKTWPSLWR